MSAGRIRTTSLARLSARLAASRAARLALLLTVLTVEVLVLLRLSTHLSIPLLRAAMRPGPMPVEVADNHDPGLDPKLGERLPVPAATFAVQGAKHASAQDKPWRVILVVGSCYSCDGANTKLWAEALAQLGVPLYVVTSDTAEKAHAYAEQHHIDCHLIPDRDRSLRRRLNAEKTPRGYVIDAAGALRYLQPITLSSQEALLSVTELVSAPRRKKP